MSLTLHNVHVHILDHGGSGPPALFLHGNPDSADMWTGIMQRLRPELRCVAFDLPGLGRSTAPEDFDYSLEHMSAFIEDLRLQLGLFEQLNLVGHGFGGMFLLAWAIKNMGQVQRMALLNTVFFADYHWPLWGRVWREPILEELGAFTWELQRGSPQLPADHIRRTHALITPAMRHQVLRLCRALPLENFSAWEKKLRYFTSQIPLLVLWGDKDPYIDKSYAERFGARKVMHYPDYGHWLAVEAAEEVGVALERWFSGTEGLPTYTPPVIITSRTAAPGISGRMPVIHLSEIPAPSSSEFVSGWVARLNQPTLTKFALFDDDPVDDNQLCVVYKENDLWHIRYAGMRKTFSKMVGPSSEITAARLLQALAAVHKTATHIEGGLRRQH